MGRFLDSIPSSEIYLTDFGFHSIGVVLGKLNNLDAFVSFVHDLFVDGWVSLVRLEPREMEKVVRAMEKFALDFDDAYHYTAAETYELTLVSFDSDFDRTERGRKTPSEILTEI
ncbi:MAG: PIN domain-containing protein [Deltaproteobacteria bacterium]|nr:PIN domain-containing protein [Deltaproteobacteria bacterium]MBW1928994.1 PIN domain-containing protein [Deltaproteobacteria bacterium]MBW2025534.1 PIN domain-containing protein [Deltaproteobacteria bacterium]MBW2126087.1 PIN domain-containing protein [Deltaproteobacteria bacterium]